MESESRTARIFISSTFRDFGEERDLLVRKVFPGLRARLKDRFVELVDVDLRWGITAEAAERGEVLPICLAEIDRARPWFVGMLGDRYGWVPPAGVYAPDLVESRPWLEEHRGGRSVTELEILHGVLNDPAMAGRAFFYFRSHAYAATKGGDYLAASDEDAARQLDLDPVLMAATNSSGGVMGKMISPQNITTGTSTTNLKGREGEVVARTFKHSIILTLILGVIVLLQQYVFPGMIPR